MRKEVAFAIFAGIGAGLFLAFGVWKLTSKVTQVNTSPTPVETESATSPNPQATTASSVLSVTKPTKLSVIGTDTVSIEGTSKPGSWVVILTSTKDYMTKTEETGSFQIAITLSPGLNNIEINSISEDSEKSNLSYQLVFSEEATDSVAYRGSITDINSSALQIKSDEGGIQQITLNSDAKLTKVKKPQNTLEDVNAEDLAIGDYVVAVGTQQGLNAVLDTKSLIVGSPDENKNTAIKGTISKLSSKSLTLTPSEGDDLVITLPKTWTGPNVSDMEVDQQIIVTGFTDDKDSFSLRSILELNQ